MSSKNICAVELKRLSKLCERVHYTQSKEPFCNHLFVVLREALPSIHFTVDHFSLAPLTLKEARNNSLPEITFEVFQYYMHQHPGIIQHKKMATQNVGTLLTELTPTRYQKTGLYNEVYRPVDIEDQVWLGVGDQQELIGISYSRDAAYTEQDTLQLSLIHPHINIAWNNWKRIRSLEKQLEKINAKRIRSEQQAHAASVMQAAIQTLSRRQREVVDWVAAGKTNIEIATELAISPRTVGKHLEQIFEIVGVHTRTALANASHMNPNPNKEEL